MDKTGGAGQLVAMTDGSALRLAVLTALAMAAFAANSVLNRMAVGGGLVGAEAFAVIRVAAGAVMLAALVGLRHVARGADLWPGWKGRGAGVAGLLVYLFGFSAAYRALDAGTGALVLFGCVQITMFAGAVVAREAVPARRWLGAGVAFAGLVLLCASGGAAVPVPAVLAMAAAGVGWGVYSLAGRGARDALAGTAANFVLALPVAWAVALASGVSFEATGGGVALAVVSGAVTSGLGYALWYAVLPGLGAARAAVAQLTVPVIAAGAGAVLLAEPPGWRFALAAVLVLGGVAVASLPLRRTGGAASAGRGG